MKKSRAKMPSLNTNGGVCKASVLCSSAGLFLFYFLPLGLIIIKALSYRYTMRRCRLHSVKARAQDVIRYEKTCFCKFQFKVNNKSRSVTKEGSVIQIIIHYDLTL